MTLTEWQTLAQDLHHRANRFRRSRWERAQRLCREAGLDNYGHIHNALLSRDAGHPWREVDYRKARAALRLFNSQGDATQLVERYLSRIWDRVVLPE